MGFFDTLLADWTLWLIPIIAGFVGWFTNVLAVKMMFKPTEFVGIPPYLGWQGVVPANAVRLATTGLNLVMSKVLQIKDLFVDFDATGFVDRESDKITEMVRKTVSEQAAELFPAMWKNMNDQVKEQVYKMAEGEVRKLSTEVMAEAAEKIGDFLDVEAIVVNAIKRDKELMGDIFLRVGSAEFKFIEISGLYFGLAFGVVQLIVWVVYPKWWVLPFFGFLVGYATNWLALWLIFEPKEPKKILGFTIHGLFHRRQESISGEFAVIMSQQILSTDNIFGEISTGESRHGLLEIVRGKSKDLIDRYKNNPMAKPLFASGKADEIEAKLMQEIENEMFAEQGVIYSFVDKADDIRTQLKERMSVMPADDFEGVLRPAFKQDEWKLILAGAVLGLAAGVAQLFFLFYDMLV